MINQASLWTLILKMMWKSSTNSKILTRSKSKDYSKEAWKFKVLLKFWQPQLRLLHQERRWKGQMYEEQVVTFNWRRSFTQHNLLTKWDIAGNQAYWLRKIRFSLTMLLLYIDVRVWNYLQDNPIHSEIPSEVPNLQDQ